MEGSLQLFYNYLEEIGCCQICILRYMKGRGNDFLFVKSSLKSLGLKLSEDDKGPVDGESDLSKSPDLKRKKSNVCIACLGLFSEDMLEQTISKVIPDPAFETYQIREFLTAISLPIILHYNQLLIWMHLIEKFPEMQISSEECLETSIKEVIRIILNTRISKILNKPITQEGLMINIFYNVTNDEEIKKLEDLFPELFSSINQQKKRTRRGSYLTRNYFEKHLIPKNMDFQKIKTGIQFPFIPSESINLEKISFTGPTVFLAGRYNKYSRELSQSPWWLNGKKIMEDSVQEIIVRDAAPFFGVSDSAIKFSSSGREDVDVRCLGKGRPFVLEIMDSKKDVMSNEEAFKMEKSINKSDKIAVRHLQIVDRSELEILKSGEEEKRKCYRALCILNKPVTLEILEKLNIPDGFDIHQITPLRVLHRRPLHSRPRRVHSMKAYRDKDNAKLLILDVVTQAGTYIKELVHGDFGRTQPSISQMIGDFIDIIALDVTAIELDWPKETNRETVELK